MNLMQQHEKVIEEIDACYSFILCTRLHNFFRILKPRSFIQYCSQIAGPWFMGLFSRKKRLSQRVIWTEGLDLLSSETTKTSSYYEIIRTDNPPIHALSEYLANKFSNYNWTDLEKANQVRENILPKFGFVKVVMGGLAIAAIIAMFKGLLDGSLWAFIQHSLIQENLLLFAELTYIFVLLLIFLFDFWKRRRRLQRAGNVLKYLTILYPAQGRCNNDAGQ